MSSFTIEPLAKKLSIEYKIADNLGIVIEESTDDGTPANLTFIDVNIELGDTKFEFDDLDDMQNFTNILHDAITEFKHEFNKLTKNET